MQLYVANVAELGLAEGQFGEPDQYAQRQLPRLRWRVAIAGVRYTVIMHAMSAIGPITAALLGWRWRKPSA